MQRKIKLHLTFLIKCVKIMDEKHENERGAVNEVCRK